MFGNRVFSVLLFLLFSFFSAQSQKISVSIDIKSDTIKIPRYDLTPAMNKIFLRMGYGGYEVMNPTDLEKLEGKRIQKVELVYTDYPKTMNMATLSKKRLVALYLVYPEIYADSSTVWHLVAQTDCKNAPQASRMFHGFVITYGEKPNLVDSSEGAYLKNVIDGKIQLRDSTVINILKRNKEWKDILVVADLTASMSPYIAQLLLWFKLNMHRSPARYFVFFNDGDGKETLQKEIGKTGGIYHLQTNSLDSLLGRALETMQNGFGGDAPENNMEAVLFGINQYTHCHDVIMIADNWATPRDLELLHQIKRPIRVILCGTEMGINPAYLDIARLTKGSLHTIEKDISRLVDMNEGEKIQIGAQSFVIKRGRFTLLK